MAAPLYFPSVHFSSPPHAHSPLDSLALHGQVPLPEHGQLLLLHGGGRRPVVLRRDQGRLLRVLKANFK